MQELAPEEPREEDPFEGTEAEQAAESATAVKKDSEEEAQAGTKDAGMAPTKPEQESEDAEMEEVPDEENVHMPATQDDLGAE